MDFLGINSWQYGGFMSQNSFPILNCNNNWLDNCYFNWKIPVFEQPFYSYINFDFPPLFNNPISQITPNFGDFSFNKPLWFNDYFNKPIQNYGFNNYSTSLSNSYSYTSNLSLKSSNLNEPAPTDKFIGYNASAGKRLANIALKNSKYVINPETRKLTSETKSPNKFTGNCARYVKRAIEDAGLGAYKNGHAYNMTSILKDNKNFKEISSATPLDTLPAGCVIVYGKGVGGHSSEYGHTEITAGNGKVVSDGIREVGKRPSAIFMPV